MILHMVLIIVTRGEKQVLSGKNCTRKEINMHAQILEGLSFKNSTQPMKRFPTDPVLKKIETLRGAMP